MQHDVVVTEDPILQGSLRSVWSLESGKLQGNNREKKREVNEAEREHKGVKRANRGGGKGRKRMSAWRQVGKSVKRSS